MDVDIELETLDDDHGTIGTAMLWQHFPFQDPRHGFEHHCLLCNDLPPGHCVKWEWRYIHDHLKLKSNPWQYLPTSSNSDLKVRFFMGLQIPIEGLFKNNQDHVSKERSISTLACLGFMCYMAKTRQAPSAAKMVGLVDLVRIIPVAFKAYHIVPAEQLLLPVDLSGPLPWQQRSGHILVTATGHLWSMQPWTDTHPDFEVAWRDVTNSKWRDHQITSQ